MTTSTAAQGLETTTAKAFIVRPDLVAWPSSAVPADSAPGSSSWRLHWSPTAELAVASGAVTSGTATSLTFDRAGLPREVISAHPQLSGYLALTVPQRTANALPEILKAQIAVGRYDVAGTLVDVAGVQIAIVLDDLYAGSASTRSYGVSFSGPQGLFSLWAPTAQKVTLLTWPAGSADAPASAARHTRMTRAQDGSWSAHVANARNVRYLYEVRVFAPTTGRVETYLVTDPASVALTLNSTRSVAVDLRDSTFMPAAWQDTPAPALRAFVDSTIYELHIRDYSMHDALVPPELRGSYAAFAVDGHGRAQLRCLARAGLNTVHLLPSFDIATIQEDQAKQATPAGDLSSFPPDSDEQQKRVSAVADQDGFNWGYDPFHFNAPEGSYASSATAADGGARVAEFRTMIGALHENGLRVVLDQVFNHTAAAGPAATSVLDKVVPGYYHRRNAAGEIETSTCCHNVATEHAMAQKLMVDSVVSWAKHYKIDGFRFDLMGHHSRANLLAVRSALNQLTVRDDGVDGSKIYLYGEGWNFGEVADNRLFVQATQGQLGGTHIGTFSDRLRDAVRGGGPFDDDPRRQGFGTGEATDPNDAPVNANAATSLAHHTDLVQLGLAGNLRNFQFRSQASGRLVVGSQIDFNGTPAGYADQPDEVISYVDAHDNETLFDALAYKLPVSTTMSDRIRMNTLALATTALAQTPSFWHAGAELLRSKSLDRDSYNSGDWFNILDWTGEDNGFGHGLPPEQPNSAKWPFMRPLLGDVALKPTAAQVNQANLMAQDLLKLRFSTPLFRLGSADLIKAKLSFPVSGTPDAHPGVIVVRIEDTERTVGPRIDPTVTGLVVVFNATPTAVAQRVPGLAGTFALSPVQVNGSDPVVQGSTYTSATSTFTVPPRTVAVFVQPG